MTNSEYRTRDDERNDDKHGSSPELDAASDNALRYQIRQNLIDDDAYGIT